MKTYEIKITGSGTQEDIIRALHHIVCSLTEKIGDEFTLEDSILCAEVSIEE